MRILIITMDVGKTAPGIVFERLISIISSGHDVDVLTSEFQPSIDLKSVKNIIQLKRSNSHPRIQKALISIFGLNPLDFLWAKRSMKKLQGGNAPEYDVVLSLISFHHYAALIAGELYSRSKKVKWAVYSVDAIPAPIGWSDNNLYFRQVKSMIARYLSKVDVFFAANQAMLDYQKSIFFGKKDLSTSVLYNPNDGNRRFFGNTDLKKNVFLYTGGVYQARKADYILEAFKRLLKSYPNSYLVFVGTKLPEALLLGLDHLTAKHVVIEPFAKDLTRFYESATALIDIDADLDNDVFLSSKIVNYLSVDRIIISETGINSPSRQLFKNIGSIIQCDHNIEELEAAMIAAISMMGNVDFRDRNDVLALFSKDQIFEIFNAAICK